jgi:outer membrane protein assembly factor BamE
MTLLQNVFRINRDGVTLPSYRLEVIKGNLALKKVSVFAVTALFAAMLSGCAGVQKVADKLDSKSGTHVTNEKLATFVKGKTRQEDVIAAIGYPPSKNEVSGKEVWSYPYTLITALPFVGENQSETTVFEFNKTGVLTNAYKAGGRAGQSGNPLLDAAGM